MASPPADNIYKLAITPSITSSMTLDSTQYPFPQMVVALAVVLLIVGRIGVI